MTPRTKEPTTIPRSNTYFLLHHVAVGENEVTTKLQVKKK